MKAQILCLLRPGHTHAFDLPAGSADLGRDPRAAVSLPLEGVSRRHARISFDGKHHWIEDMKSTNGTFLNGQSVQRDRLRHLDVITLGKKVDLLYVQRGEAHVTKKPGIVRATLNPENPELAALELPLGEVSLGRAVACNLVLDKPAVSKIHARIERTGEQLVLRDLESANGTFVNGARVTTAVLRDGDVVSLGGVEEFRVAIERGEVVIAAADVSVIKPAPAAVVAAAPSPKPRFSNEWKTRFDWNTGEREQIALLQQKLAEDDRQRARAGKPQERPPARVSPAAGQTPRPGTIKPPPRPAAPADMTMPPPAAAASVAAAPAPAPTPPPAPAPAMSVAPPAAEDGATILPGMARVAAKPAPVQEVRLTGGGFDVTATATGHHSLGRSSEASLRINDATVSRQHARITLTEDRSAALMQDLGGANGTFLNGAALKSIEALADGDVVQLGDVILKVAVRRG